MSKFYKQLSTCTMCKQRFTVNREKGSYTSSNYCPACISKYFPKKEVPAETVSDLS